MVFKHLEDSIPEGRVETYLQVFSNLHEPTKTVLAYSLDLAAHFNNLGLNREYVLFGGYAVLSHLMKDKGENIASVWRGSNDIDMAGNMKVLNAIRSGYNIKSCLESPNLEDKATIKLAADENEECKIDFYKGNFAEKFGDIETNIHFGIPVNVISPLSLIKGKLITPKGELQHTGDIIGMLYVLEKRGYTSKQITDYLSRTGESKNLHDRLKIGREEFKSDRLGIFPTELFLRELDKRLHKSRPITKK
ncbi:MAG: hypothetical protein AABW65_00210 [Nanoarchaeota archaeon]